MHIRTLMATAAASALLATAAFGAATTPTQQCAALEKQFDQELVTHGAAAKVGQARALRADGEKLCRSGKPKTGVKKLNDALDDLGVKPQSFP
jgi:hypothetical protein